MRKKFPIDRRYDGDDRMNSFGMGSFPDTVDGSGLTQSTYKDDVVGEAPMGTNIYKSAKNLRKSSLIEFFNDGDDDDVQDIQSFVAEDCDRLPNLEWLEGVVQDAERLPVNSVDLMMKELNTQWKYDPDDERGVKVVAEDEYIPANTRLSSASIDPNYVRPVERKIGNVEAVDIIRSSFKKMAAGVDKILILDEVKKKLGSRFKDFEEMINKDYGLNRKQKEAKKSVGCSNCKSEKCKCAGSLDRPTHNEDQPRLAGRLEKYKTEAPKISDPLTVKKGKYLNSLVSSGLISADDGNKIMKKASNLNEAKKMAGSIINSVKPKTYDGVEMTRPSDNRWAYDERSGEVKKLVKWAKKEMSEGVAGSRLDSLIKTIFSPVLVKKASAELKAARKDHEGLSGFLYVDAEAYGKSLKDCERGGLVHRANQIPYVLGMDKCAGCVERNGDRCNKYRKDVVSREVFDGKEMAEYRRQVMASLDKKDYESTADLFSDRHASVNPFADMDLDDDCMDASSYRTASNENDLPGLSEFDLDW